MSTILPAVRDLIPTWRYRRLEDGTWAYTVDPAAWWALVDASASERAGETIVMERPAQTNCANEPAYPGHDTVVFALSAPDMTAHLATERCTEECPHLIAECGEFVMERGADD
jgi:hypothetical protein